MDFPIKIGDFPSFFVCLPKGNPPIFDPKQHQFEINGPGAAPVRGPQSLLAPSRRPGRPPPNFYVPVTAGLSINVIRKVMVLSQETLINIPGNC